MRDRDEPKKIAHRREAVSGEAVLVVADGEVSVVDDGEGDEDYV
jgi:hypothetical protein